MRTLLVFLAATALLGATARAEKRIFIVIANADGYGVDRCLVQGAECGAAMARTYCESRDFRNALSFRKVDPKDITGAVPLSDADCKGGRCDDFVAIECAR